MWVKWVKLNSFDSEAWKLKCHSFSVDTKKNLCMVDDSYSKMVIEFRNHIIDQLSNPISNKKVNEEKRILIEAGTLEKWNKINPDYMLNQYVDLDVSDIVQLILAKPYISDKDIIIKWERRKVWIPWYKEIIITPSDIIQKFASGYIKNF